MPKKDFIPQKDTVWIEARKRFHLSHAQIQMARELGMNPGSFGSLANHRQESTGTVEGAAAGVYRGPLLQTLRQIAA